MNIKNIISSFLILSPIFFSACDQKEDTGLSRNDGKLRMEIAIAEAQELPSLDKAASKASSTLATEETLSNLFLLIYDRQGGDNALPAFCHKDSMPQKDNGKLRYAWDIDDLMLPVTGKGSGMAMGRQYDVLVLANLPQRTIGLLPSDISMITKQQTLAMNEEMGNVDRAVDGSDIAFSAMSTLTLSNGMPVITAGLKRNVARLDIEVTDDTGIQNLTISEVHLLNEQKFSPYFEGQPRTTNEKDTARLVNRFQTSPLNYRYYTYDNTGSENPTEHIQLLIQAKHTVAGTEEKLYFIAPVTGNGNGISRNVRYLVRAKLKPATLEVSTEIVPWQQDTVRQTEMSISKYPNSYMLKPGGAEIEIPMRVINLTPAPDAPENYLLGGEILNDTLIWVDGLGSDNLGLSPTGVISSLSVTGTGTEAKLRVTPGTKEGNALVGVRDANNKIRWSWHIWVTSYDPETAAGHRVYTNSTGTYVFMDRDLGATSIIPGDLGTFGLFYQWGRKDPFRGTAAVSGSTLKTLYNKQGSSFTELEYPNFFPSIDLAIANPDRWSGRANSAGHWGGSSTFSVNLWGNGLNKSVYDPCPAGWKVPGKNAFDGISDADFKIIQSNGTTWGYEHNIQGFFSLSGYRSIAQILTLNVGSIKYLYTSDNTSSISAPRSTIFSLRTSGTIAVIGTGFTKDMFSVRCVKE